jgi:predicted LPLAT superfamily acyltransferase
VIELIRSAKAVLDEFEAGLMTNGTTGGGVRHLFERAHYRRDRYLSLRGRLQIREESVKTAEFAEWAVGVCTSGGLIHGVRIGDSECIVAVE